MAKVKSGYYIVTLICGQDYRVKAERYTEAVNKIIDEKNCNLSDIVDANPEWIDR